MLHAAPAETQIRVAGLSMFPTECRAVFPPGTRLSQPKLFARRSPTCDVGRMCRHTTSSRYGRSGVSGGPGTASSSSLVVPSSESLSSFPLSPRQRRRLAWNARAADHSTCTPTDSVDWSPSSTRKHLSSAACDSRSVAISRPSVSGAAAVSTASWPRSGVASATRHGAKVRKSGDSRRSRAASTWCARRARLPPVPPTSSGTRRSTSTWPGIDKNSAATCIARSICSRRARFAAACSGCAGFTTERQTAVRSLSTTKMFTLGRF
mmetsp:Transcript_30582/g.94476  ORF Transcript_30582/g.94476 Transcript_30582/m.94476 type:complete len:265 (-) Transcript_30582:1015-1809(-)